MAAEQPKKPPLRAFFMYIQDNRAAIIKELGDKAKVKGMVSKTAAEQWCALAAADKALYEEKVAAAKVEYDKALENFKASGGEVKGRQIKSKKRDKLKKSKDAPTRPTGGGYWQFLAENREKIAKSLPHGTNPLSGVAKEAGAQWKALPENERKVYNDMYSAKMVEFKAAMETYKDKDAPKKPSRGGGWGQFLAENREKIAKSLPHGALHQGDIKEAAAQWKALPESERKVYNDMYSAKMVEFKAAMETYKASRPAEAAEPETPARKKSIVAVKRPSPTKEKTASATKKARTSSSSKGPEMVEIDADVLAEAQKLGWESALRNLAGRSDVRDLGKTDEDLLAAIKGSEGLVNPARRALLGA